jgi:hypothetical protein
LEVAAADQAVRFEKVYSLAEDMTGLLNDEIRSVERLRNRIELSVRHSSPGSTEGAVKAKVASYPALEVALKRVESVRIKVLKLKGIVDAARQRKSMIRTLSDLYIANYWDKTTKLGTPVTARRPLKAPLRSELDFS